MKFLTKYSLFANVVSIIVVTAAILYISEKSIQGGGNPKTFKPAKSVQVTAFNFHYNEYNDKGMLKTNFFFKKLEKYVEKYTTMTGVFEKNYDVNTGKVTSSIQAEKGFVNDLGVSNLIHLFDGVNIVMFVEDEDDNLETSEDSQKINSNTKNSKKSHDISSKNKVYIKSDDIKFNTKTHDFYNNKFVEIYEPENDNNTTAIGVKGNSQTKIIKLEKDVRSYYESS